MIMKQKEILVIICLAFCLLISGVYANDVSITPARVQHQIGETQSYTLLLDSAPEGLSGFNITITVQNPLIARITRVTFDTSWASIPKNSTVPASSVWCKAVDLDGGSGTANITLCTILVRAENYGTTNITIIPEKVEDRQAGRYTPSVVPATLTVSGGDAPVANFTANVTSGTVPLAVQFTDMSPGAPSAWIWNFGDGSTATAQHPVHTYASAGIYTVSLNATNAGGSNTKTVTGYIAVVEPIPAPASNFTANVTEGLSPRTIQFTDA
jgi:PKD repeat protein